MSSPAVETSAASQTALRSGGSSPGRIAYERCPLCNSLDFKSLRTADITGHPSYRTGIPESVTWMRCLTCEHVFTDGYFNDAAIALIFGGDVKGQVVGEGFMQWRGISARMVSRVARFMDKGAWLDVGFGNGSLLFTADEFGYECVGLDMRRQNVEAMRGLGFEAHNLDLIDLDADGRFSVISMADVLEHMPFPMGAIQKAYQCMKPGGVMLVSMPNYDSAAWRLMGEKNPYWAELEHYHNFSRSNLIKTMDRHGFRFVEYGVSERYIACMEVLFMRD